MQKARFRVMPETVLKEEDAKKSSGGRYCFTLQFFSAIEKNKCGIRRVLDKDMVKVVVDLNHF